MIMTSVNRSRHFEINRLIKSLNQQTVNLRLIFVHQIDERCRPYSTDELEPVGQHICFEYITSGISSLSEARNIGLSLAVSPCVSFPDDDCWYPPNFLDSIDLYFTEQSVAVVAFHVGDPSTGMSYGGRPKNVRIKINKWNIFRLPISVGIFIDTRKVRKDDLLFDLRFGAGKYWGSGEETEMLARLYKGGCQMMYEGGSTVFHPVDRETAIFTPAKAYRYGVGFGALSAHLLRMGLWAHFYELQRVICVTFFGIVIHALFFRFRRSSVSVMRLIGITTGMWSYLINASSLGLTNQRSIKRQM
jgi:hypothetical protein